MNIQTPIKRHAPLGNGMAPLDFWRAWSQAVADAAFVDTPHKEMTAFVLNQRTISMGRTRIKLAVLEFQYLDENGKPPKPGQKRNPKSYRGARRNAARIEYRKQKHK